MMPPPRISHDFGYVCKLKKVLHGLQQAPRAWFEKFSVLISSLGFVLNSHDFALFIKCTNAGRIILSLYVDDIIITGNDIDGIFILKTELARQFEMTDLGSLRYFMGIEVAYSPRGYFFSQSKYVADIVERARFTNNKTINTLIEVNIRHSSSDGVPLLDPTLYRTILLGAWYIYLTITRPYIIYVVYIVSQFVASLNIGQLFFVFCNIFGV